MATEQPAQWGSPPPPPDIRYGGFWRRFVAYMADGVIVSVLFVPVGLAFVLDPRGIVWVILIVVAGLAAAAYFPFFWARSGSTPAMAALGLRVVRADDGRGISGWRALGRYLGMGLAAIPLYIGLIWAAFEPRKRGWHDLIARTVVVRTPEAGKAKRIAVYVAAGLAIASFPATIVLSAMEPAGLLLNAEVGQDAPGARSGAPIVAPTTMPFADVRIGHCFNPTGDLVEVAVEGVPCEDAHVFELAAVRELPPGEYPATVAGQDDLATRACQASVLRYVGFLSTEQVFLSYVGLLRENWEAGDRRVWCLIHNADATPVEGTARDGWR